MVSASSNNAASVARVGAWYIVTGGRSRPKASPMALNTSSAVAESPPSSKKLSSSDQSNRAAALAARYLQARQSSREADLFFRMLIVV